MVETKLRRFSHFDVSKVLNIINLKWRDLRFNIACHLFEYWQAFVEDVDKSITIMPEGEVAKCETFVFMLT